MAFSRRLGVIGIVGASWLLAIGCDDGDDQIPQGDSAGEAGESPLGGKSSAAGSQNNGGKAGGGAGKGGTTSAGNGGSSGGNGNAGSGGTTSGAGQAGASEVAGASGSGGESLGGNGSGGGGGGTGGDGGSAGDGGTIPAIVVPHCSFACTGDEDCLIDDDDTYKCLANRCEDPSDFCTNDQECLINLSNFGALCANDAGCTASTQACVQANGQGYCAALPSASDPACISPKVAKVLPRFGAAGTVEVCASADPRCFAGKCAPGCGDLKRPCGLGLGDTCNSATGLCECATGGECEKTGVCGRDKHCDTCKTNEDCTGEQDPVCNQGHCGCAAPDVCFDLGYANATAQCQLL